MFDRLKRLYAAGKISVAELQNAVTLGWISEAQYEEIINGDENVEKNPSNR